MFCQPSYLHLSIYFCINKKKVSFYCIRIVSDRLRSRQMRTEPSFTLFWIYSNPFESPEKQISLFLRPLFFPHSSADTLKHGGVHCACLTDTWTDTVKPVCVHLPPLLNCHSGCQPSGTEMDSSWIQQVIAAHLFRTSRGSRKDGAQEPTANCTASKYSGSKEYLHGRTLKL